MKRNGWTVLACAAVWNLAAAQATPHPVLFVTQVPVANDFTVLVSTFGNHLSDMGSAPRGGDLMIRYPDGTLRNLTAEAGLGSSGFQGANAIAVRDPDVHWSGQKAVFSMVVGAPAAQFQLRTDYWQLYEATGLAQGQAVAIARVPGQPADHNNIDPAYGADGSIVFTSDRPRDGQRHLYPQHDEYESAPTVTGLWKLGADGRLRLLQHSPSGSFDPIIDSFGRIVFTRWDHLQQDQQAEADNARLAAGQPTRFGTFDFSDESAGAARIDSRVDVFPEPRFATAGVNGLRFNSFGPWTVRHDGTGEETLNHVGRHELHAFFARSFTGDGALRDFNDLNSGRANPNVVLNVMQMAEDPTQPGRFVAVDAPEFDTNGSGQLIAFEAPTGASAEDFTIEYLTPRSTAGTDPDAPGHSGHYRDPVVLADGSVLAAHASERGGVRNLGTGTAPDPAYDFRLRLMQPGTGGLLEPGPALTAGIEKTVSWFTPDVLVTYSGPLWELSPVEVRPRPQPPADGDPAPAPPEQAAFDAAGVSAAAFAQWLRRQDLAVFSIRDTTSRDDIDLQQPINLRIPGGVQTVAPGGGTVYDVSHMQFLQADQVRGIGGIAQPEVGRRPVARILHEPTAVAFNADGPAPPGSVAVAADGSVAAFVPAQRAMSWQLLSPTGQPVVRERYWITAQPGEVRACDGCHGVNTANQAGAPAAQNTPQALVALLQRWSASTGFLFADGFD